MRTSDTARPEPGDTVEVTFEAEVEAVRGHPVYPEERLVLVGPDGHRLSTHKQDDFPVEPLGLD